MDHKGRFIIAYYAGESSMRTAVSLSTDNLEVRLARHLCTLPEHITIVSVHFKPDSLNPPTLT